MSHPPTDADTRAVDAARRLAADVLRPRAEETDRAASFPTEQIAAIAAGGLMGIAILPEYGGLDLSYLAQARVFAALAEGDLATAFVVSQHHACTTLVAATPRAGLRERWLGALATGQAHAANGFNFLNFPPDRAPMRAVAVTGGYRLTGSLPWVTAAHVANFLAAGAVLPDGAQVMAAIALAEGVASGAPIRVEPAMDLMALAGSDTTVVHFDDLFVAESDVLLGPGPNLLKTTFRGATVYVPTAMALGHARASLAVISDVAASKGGTASAMAAWLSPALDRLDADLTAALEGGDFERAPALRGRANALVARAAHLALIAGGGTGYRRDRTPQRLYREAAFFSVWSVSGAIIPETLSHLLA